MSKRKSRLLNNLSLDEKLRVLKAYSEQPSYQQLADAFKCSSKQIRNILFDRNNLLAEHASVQNLKKDQDQVQNQDAHKRNLRNISLIDKVVAEWYYRAKLYPTTEQITYKMIREKVQEAREVLHIATFIPTNSWMTNFRKDCEKNVRKRSVHGTSLLPLNIKVIAKHVLQQQNVTKEQMKSVYGIDDHDEEFTNTPPLPMVARLNCIHIAIRNPEPNSVIEIDPYADEPLGDGENKLVDMLAVQVDPNKNEIPKVCETDHMLRKDDQPRNRVLESTDDALRYLKPLEDFALLKENYRAIGLITQIEAHFCKTRGK